MKPSELGIRIEQSNAYKTIEKILKNYLEKDCVIAYNKNKASIIFLIKTAKTYMGFCYFSKELKTHLYSARILNRISLNSAVNLIDGEGIILDKKGFSRIKRQIVLENLR